MKNTGIVIASLVGGMIIGSALTMLFTPQSGAELRKQIKDLIGDEVDQGTRKSGRSARQGRGGTLQMRGKVNIA